MIYIDKNIKPTSLEAATALHSWRDTYVFKYEEGFEYRKKKKESEAAFTIWFEKYKRKDLKDVDIENKIFMDICENLNAESAWNLIEEYGGGLKKKLKEALLKEQSGICCYCLQDISEALLTIIEHFLAKSNDKATCDNTYNYQNLLLSCDGNRGANKGEIYQVKKEDKSWEDVVKAIEKRNERRPDFTIDVASLKEMNPLQQQDGVPKGNLFYRMPSIHCDNYKENKTDVIINPTTATDCSTRFQYHEKGLIEGKDEQATLTVTVLNLNAYILQESRRNKWREFDEVLNQNADFSTQYVAEDWASLKTFLQTELDLEEKLTYPFCTVKRALLLEKIKEAQLLESL
jgi:uncharacterized protein (TIGR02646 family)